MAYGSTVSTHLTSFVGAPDANGTPTMWGTGTKMAVGSIKAGATSQTVTVVGDIQKKTGTPPAGSQYGTSLPNTDVIKGAFLLKTSMGVTPVDVTRLCTIAGDNSVKVAGCTAAQASNAFLIIIFDQQDKMGSKN